MKLLIIDPHVTRKSPSMRGWVNALPVFRDLFDEIEVWADQCDEDVARVVRWHRVELRLPFWRLQALEYTRKIRKRRACTPRDPEQITQVIGCTIPDADIHYIHYWNQAFLEERAKRPDSLKIGWTQRIPAAFAARDESATVARNIPHRQWWVVSRSLAERIKSQGASGEFHILPNQYNPDRFHSGLRDAWRDQMRVHHGFTPGENVLAFSAFGHFERKGLRQGIEAVTELRRRGHSIRYLILGGTPATLQNFRKKLTAEQEAACVFTGMVDHIERHLVAADGLLFPSHFEAFSLAEIEAAALGLRLYLTPHYGSEMILREPVNGRWLPWQPDGMANTIEEDILNGQLGTTHAELGEAITPDAYATRLRELYAKAIEAHRMRSGA